MSSSASVVRAVRTLSDAHRTSAALLRREMTVHQFLETKVFSPENFPTVLKLGISFSFLEFCGVFGLKYMQQNGAAAVASGANAAAASAAGKAATNAATAGASSFVLAGTANGAAASATTTAVALSASGPGVYRYLGE